MPVKARGRRRGVTAAMGAKLPRPVDPVELAAQNVANRDYATTTAGLTAEEGQVKQSFGLDDPSDPFSKGALLKQNFERAKAQATNSYASRGQLYAGALQNQHDYVRGNYNQDYAGLRAQQTSLLDDIVRRRTRAGDVRQDTIDTAAGDALTRAVNTPVDPDTVPAKKHSKKKKKGS